MKISRSIYRGLQRFTIAALVGVGNRMKWLLHIANEVHQILQSLYV